VKLNPAKYTCPDHHTDLTSQVLDALDEDGPPVAYDRQPLLGRTTGPRPFEVPVTCPGTDGRAHQLICAGTYTR
jgi:hypothetical protein